MCDDDFNSQGRERLIYINWTTASKPTISSVVGLAFGDHAHFTALRQCFAVYSTRTKLTHPKMPNNVHRWNGSLSAVAKEPTTALLRSLIGVAPVERKRLCCPVQRHCFGMRDTRYEDARRIALSPIWCSQRIGTNLKPNQRLSCALSSSSSKFHVARGLRQPRTSRRISLLPLNAT